MKKAWAVYVAQAFLLISYLCLRFSLCAYKAADQHPKDTEYAAEDNA